MLAAKATVPLAGAPRGTALPKPATAVLCSRRAGGPMCSRCSVSCTNQSLRNYVSPCDSRRTSCLVGLVRVPNACCVHLLVGNTEEEGFNPTSRYCSLLCAAW